MSLTNWQIAETSSPPSWLVAKVGKFAAQLLVQRGMVSHEQVESFLSTEAYQPTSAFAFPEMSQAIARICQAYERGETISIWGDFDADGITATAVLWEGLGQFFAQGDRLVFYIPDRLKESHGISINGLGQWRSQLAETGQSIDLLITCDTGSTNIEAIAYANSLGIDVIVTDHHTLPDQRPPVVAIINPRYLPDVHPLFHLSGVAVAYKLMEALYETLPDVLQQSLEQLLDLVAIGLVADLVQLKGDCRYLAQRGIEVLRQKQREGVKLLLEQCKRSGDRPIDISFGIAPRINAVSRIWGDVRKCVDLLTSRDLKLCKSLVDQTELANTERKALQRQVFKQVKQKIDQLDLSTTGIILLADAQWSAGVLGLVAGQVVAEYARPTILCTIEDGIARGSARSLEGINLYELLKGQEHLLLSFGGHPLAGGLSFAEQNLRVLAEAIDQRFWNQYGQLKNKSIDIHLEVTIPDLNRDLSEQFRLLEPFGMGNPSPNLLVRDCEFVDISFSKIQNRKGKKIEYIKTDFTLRDRQGNQIHGHWWGHYGYELPDTTCDVIVELVDNAPRQRYDVRLIDFHARAEPLVPSADFSPVLIPNASHPFQIVDWRGRKPMDWQEDLANLEANRQINICDRCPQSWQEWQAVIDQAAQSPQTLALVYAPPQSLDGAIAWQILVGIAKYLSRTGQQIRRSQLIAKLGISDRHVLEIGFAELQHYGYVVEFVEAIEDFTMDADPMIAVTSIDVLQVSTNSLTNSSRFIQVANELIFQQQFFDRKLISLAA